tara:strand:+ start:2024 stop:3724 length:1701 start_codon:yes stop_codon:yes gene_type:complete
MLKISRKHLRAIIEEGLSSGQDNVLTEAVCSHAKCFKEVSREGVILGKLVEFSVLDALKGSLRGGSQDLPSEGAFSGTQDVDKFFNDASVPEEYKKSAFSVYKAAYYAVQMNEIFDELGVPTIDDITQDTGTVDVPTSTADIHVKYNEKPGGGRFGNIRKLRVDESEGAVEGFYSRELWDQSMLSLMSLMRLNSDFDSAVVDTKMSWRDNMIAGKFITESNGLNRGGILESSGQRPIIRKILGISPKRRDDLTKALEIATTQANDYRKYPGAKGKINWSSEGSAWSNFKSLFLRSASAVSESDDPIVKMSYAEDFMKEVDKAFVDFVKVKKIYQAELQNQYENLTKLLDGVDVSVPSGPTIQAPRSEKSGNPFSKVFITDLIRVLFDHIIEDEDSEDSLTGSSAMKSIQNERIVSVLRVCWKCKDEVTVVIEKFEVPGGSFKTFADSMEIRWDTTKSGLSASIGAEGKDYFYLRARTDGKSTGPQYGGGKHWNELVQSTYSAGSSSAAVEWAPAIGVVGDPMDDTQDLTMLTYSDLEAAEFPDDELESVQKIAESQASVYSFLFEA